MRTTSSDSRSTNPMRTLASGSSDAPKRFFRLRAPYAHPLRFPCSGVRKTPACPAPGGKGVEDDRFGALGFHVHSDNRQVCGQSSILPRRGGDFGNSPTGKSRTPIFAEGALLIALEDYPRLDIDRYLAQLDDLAARVARAARPASRPFFAWGICTPKCSMSIATAAKKSTITIRETRISTK